MFRMITEVLNKYEVYMHQLTPNALDRLSVYTWVVHSKGVPADVEAFCGIHELHYHTKARASNKLHNNFVCYSFAYRKDSRFLVLAYLKSGQLNGPRIDSM
jgi:hypothetical protein